MYGVETGSLYHNMCQSQIISRSLILLYRTKPGDKLTMPYMDKKVVPSKPAGTSHVCLFPDHSGRSQHATYTIMRDQDKSGQGYFKQAVPAVLPCLVFQMSGMINFSLLREYLFTEPNMDQFQFRLGNLRANVGVGSVELSLTKPCTDEYQILARYHANTPCWAGNFTKPGVGTDKDSNIDIDLQLFIKGELLPVVGGLLMGSVSNRRLGAIMFTTSRLYGQVPLGPGGFLNPLEQIYFPRLLSGVGEEPQEVEGRLSMPDRTCQRYVPEREYYNDDPCVDFLYDNLMTPRIVSYVTGVQIKDLPDIASESQYELEREGVGRVRRISIDSRGHLVIDLSRQ